MDIKQLENFIVQHDIIIPNECWNTFMSFFGSQALALKSTCIDVNLIQNQYANQTQDCLKQHIPYNELLKLIHDLNPFKHGFFNAPLTEMYLVLAYIAYIRKDREKLRTIMLSFAAYMVTTMFRKYFSKGCNSEVMQMLLDAMHSKSIYKKYNLDHVEIIKHVVEYAMKRHTDTPDIIFRWMRNIKAHINQLMKTLAQNYYKMIKELKDNRATGQIVQTSIESFMSMFKNALFHAKESLPQIARNTSFLKDVKPEAIECLVETLDDNQLYQWFIDLLNTNKSLKDMLFDPSSCKQIKNVYYKLLYALKVFTPLKTWLSFKYCDIQESQAYKVIAFLFIFAWKIAYCNNNQ